MEAELFEHPLAGEHGKVEIEEDGVEGWRVAIGIAAGEEAEGLHRVLDRMERDPRIDLTQRLAHRQHVAGIVFHVEDVLHASEDGCDNAVTSGRSDFLYGIDGVIDVCCGK